MPSQKRLHSRTGSYVAAFALVLSAATSVFSQETGQYDKGTPPQHAAGVSPLGSYTSADLGTINLTNGALNFKLSLATIGGRGFSLPLTLNYSSKVWSASRGSDIDSLSFGEFPVAYARFADIENLMDIYTRVAPGWTIGAVPTLIARGNGIRTNTTAGCGFNHAVTKLTVILPDKGEIQLRDDLTDGSPVNAVADPGSSCFIYDGYRGRRWHATDGSGIVFISDNDNGVVHGDLAGVLITADGTRFRFIGTSGSPNASVDGMKVISRALSITDRNGNRIDISYPNGSEVDYTDQLGRVTRIQKSVADPQNPSVTLALLVTFSGYQGQPHYYKLKEMLMNQRYRAGINPTLPVINGDYDPQAKGFAYQIPHTSLFAQSYGMYAERIDQQNVLSELVLPDGRSLQFFYNEYGEVAEVQMPTGGKVQYDYQYVSTLPAGKSLPGEVMSSRISSNVTQIERAVVARRTYPDGLTKDADWAYGYTTSSSQVTAINTAGAVLLNQKHYFLSAGRDLYPSPGAGIPVPDRGVEGSAYTLWSTGVDRRTETLNANGTVIIAATEEDWTQRTPIAWTASSYGSYQTENDNRVNEERTFLDTGAMARVDTLYDRYNNPIEVQQYDYDQSLKRRTTTTYADSVNLINGLDYTSDSIHLLRLPLATTVYDGSNNQAAQSVNEYDNYASDGNHAPLQDYGLVTQHDSNYGASYTTRGNLTRAGRWLNLTNGFIYSYPRYDDLGNVVAAKDANGRVSSISFADDFGNGSNPGAGASGSFGATYALPTLITSPPPTTGAPAHIARSQYDFSTGLLTGFKDRNGIITQTFYNDSFDRLTQVRSALGISGVESHAAIYYAPATAFGITLTNNDVLSVKDQTSLDDGVLRSWTRTDGFGRTVEGWSKDPQGDVKVATTYDALGRTKQVSNPFRPSLGETAIYSTTAFDLAGRVTSVTTPDSAVVTTAYSGNTVTVTDQTGKQRKSVSDALGRLIQVYEAPNDANYNYLTSYSYDALDDLLTVTQGTQPPRSFIYNSLKRLTSASNPESGTVSYSYDNNGNLLTKTDARGVASTYTYDALNRSVTRTYSDGTPTVTYAYDPNIANGKGRLSSVSSSVSTYNYSSYDALGRVLGGNQTLGNQTFSMSYTYDLAGHLLTQNYPSGRIVTNAYDSAGRTTSVTGNLGDGTTRTYSTGIIYSSLGGMTKEQFGTTTPIYNKLFYNSRGQLSEIRESTSYTGPTDTTWDRGAIINHYSNSCWGMCGGSSSTTSMTDNNGNLKKQDVYIPGSDMFTQFYGYDSLNRLQKVNESRNGAPVNWQQQYVYDRYGNRTVDQTNTWGAGIPKPNFGVDTVTNRLTAPAGYTMSYDAAGNLTFDNSDGLGGTRTYDAKNRMTGSAGILPAVYSYDGDGHRVKRIVNGTETWQVYGLGGELVAEYAANANPASPQKEYGYRNGQLLITAEPGQTQTPMNAALAANGATASASSTLDSGRLPIAAINGDRKGIHWGSDPATGSGWHDATNGVYPDWLEVDFNGSKTINELDVFGVQDNFNSPAEPTATMTFTSYGLTDFEVQYWNGSAWADVPGGNVTGNNLVWRKFTFAQITTTKVRVLVSNTPGPYNYSRVVELEAWTAGTTSAAQLHWLVTDQLGTPRMVFDQSGSLANVSRHDYLPFGEELFAGAGGRTTAQGYSASDGVRQHFSQKERDNETGLDYFGARYYASIQGRFTSPDPMLSSGDVVSPESWNRYAYVDNNPLRYIDPLGLYEWDASLGGNLSDADLKTRSKDKANYTKQQRKEYKHELNKRKEFRNALAAADRASHSRSLTAQQRADVASTVGAYGSEGQHNGVTVGVGNLAPGTGAQAQLTGYEYNSVGVANLALIHVTIDEHTTGQVLAIAVAHEGYHVEADQSAVGVWTATGSYQQARSSPLNLTTYDNESNAYHISTYMAMALGRSELTYSDASGRYQIWRRGMQNVDQQALNGLLSGHYHATPMSRGSTILP